MIAIIATEIQGIEFKGKWLCRSSDTEQIVRYIRFTLDGEKDFCYRSRRSYNAFAHSLKRRNYNPKSKTLFVCDHEEGKLWIDESLPMIDVTNVWEFYKLIGYNYKKKKFDGEKT